MKYTHVIWDFNGTILDDVEAGILAVNRLLAERGLPVLSGREDYYRVFHFPIRSYYEDLGFDFSVESYEALAPKWVALYLTYVAEAPLCTGVKETLEALRARGLVQTLLSATERRMLHKQVEDLGLRAYFDSLLGRDDIHAHSKVAIAEAWRAANPDAHAFMIGDTEHDKEAADAMGMDCYLIAGGHQSRETLVATGAPVFDTLWDLTRFLMEEGKI